ncbi:MAG TPA: cysteine--tRNA ligase [Oscillospiraceae bacterium]|nr:cysteine--tRNA ligase [Oscillospiraceae bacterium]HNW04919.1 cysteine--tRNA ligase [Oscillospiraceae bacterium]
MRVYNTMTRQKEELVPLSPGEYKIYACGPTVYNLIHIGNARPICIFDVLRRYLEYKGNKVVFVQNFTDIDDKLIRRAAEENTTVKELSDRYIREYQTDAAGLGVPPATIHPRATETVPEILQIIEGLVEKGYAYALPGGSVYFRTRKFGNYGGLSGQSVDDLESGARIDVDGEKEDPLDFCLWKGAKPDEPSWSSPWGEGRPGWHIECTAMIRKFLGETIDIHCGGQDLIFPHHENEIAQGECFSGKPYVRYWMHNGYINVDNVKMSKSLGNFFTVREVAEKFGYEPIKFMMIQAHYRMPLNYTLAVIASCKAALERLYTCRGNLDFALQNGLDEKTAGEEEFLASLEARQRAFDDAMDDDLNTADAVAAVFDLAKDINSFLTVPRSKAALAEAAGRFDTLTGVLGILYNRKTEALDAEIEAKIAAREAARKAKNWAESDRVRDELKAEGILLEDTPQGVKWRRA